MAVGSYSHRVGGDGAVAKRLEGAAPLRGEQVAHRQPDEGEQRHAQPVEAAGAEAHPEKRRPRKAQTLRAPGQPLHLVQYGDVERGEAHLDAGRVDVDDGVRLDPEDGFELGDRLVEVFDNDPNLGRHKLRLDLLHIVAILNCINDGRIR